MSVTNRVLNALESGSELTARQISARYGVTNSRDVIYNLRNDGHAIYLNSRKDSHGRVTQKYRLGNPSKQMVAAGYRALREG